MDGLPVDLGTKKGPRPWPWSHQSLQIVALNDAMVALVAPLGGVGQMLSRGTGRNGLFEGHCAALGYDTWYYYTIYYIITVVTINCYYGVITTIFAIVTMTTIIAIKSLITYNISYTNYTRQDPRNLRFAQRTSPLDLELSGGFRRVAVGSDSVTWKVRPVRAVRPLGRFDSQRPSTATDGSGRQDMPRWDLGWWSGMSLVWSEPMGGLTKWSVQVAKLGVRCTWQIIRRCFSLVLGHQEDSRRTLGGWYLLFPGQMWTSWTLHASRAWDCGGSQSSST